MNRFLVTLIMGVCYLVTSVTVAVAGQPNIVLSRALHFPAPDGTSIALSPGKYFIEQAGSTTLRLIPEGTSPGAAQVIHADALTHEQYELFSPMALTRPQKNNEYLIELLMPGGIRLEAKGSTHAPPSGPSLRTEPVPTASTPDVPPSPHVPVVETPKSVHPIAQEPILEDSMATASSPSITSTSVPVLPYQAPEVASQGKRIIVDKQETGKDPIFLSVLSPDHIGLTIFEQPALFWFIGNQTDHPVDVMITDENNTQMLLDVRMLPPIRPGIHKVELKDYGIKLHPDTTYQWKIMLQGSTQGESLVTSGWIMRITPPSNLINIPQQPTLQAAPLEQLMEAGLWYDAFWALSERIQSHPTDTIALEQRAGLFEQVGLFPPAQHDRSHIQGP